MNQKFHNLRYRNRILFFGSLKHGLDQAVARSSGFRFSFLNSANKSTFFLTPSVWLDNFSKTGVRNFDKVVSSCSSVSADPILRKTLSNNTENMLECILSFTKICVFNDPVRK